MFFYSFKVRESSPSFGTLRRLSWVTQRPMTSLFTVRKTRTIFQPAKALSQSQKMHHCLTIDGGMNFEAWGLLYRSQALILFHYYTKDWSENKDSKTEMLILTLISRIILLNQLCFSVVPNKVWCKKSASNFRCTFFVTELNTNNISWKCWSNSDSFRKYKKKC